MGIFKMIGKVDGVEIIFQKDDSGFWTTVVPKDLDGEYVVEVQAFDDAGNVAYATSMLFIVNPSILEVKIIPLTFSYKENDEKFVEKNIASNFAFYEVNGDLKFKELPDNFTAKEVG